MRVIVKVFASLRDKLGWSVREVELRRERPSFRDLLEELADLKNIVLIDGDNLAEGFIVLVNGINIRFTGGLGTALKDGDEIAVFPPSGGG